jgi:mono/diheme cytochrome c family protein
MWDSHMKRTVILLGAAAIFVGAMGPFTITAQSGAAKPQAASQPTPHAKRINFEKEIVPILATHCAGCHSGPKPRGGMNLSFKDENEARARLRDDDTFWERVETEVSTKQMPPAGRKPPTDAQRELLAEWIFTNVMTLDGKPDPGPFMVRRLNNREYANTVRDLLYLPPTFDVTADFPADERGDGFDNNAGTLTISPLLIERYLAAAEKATVAALGLDPRIAAPRVAEPGVSPTFNPRSKLNEPSAQFREDFADRQAKIRLNLEVLAPRAYRRPVTKREIDELMKFAALSFAHAGESFDQATGLSARAAMMSPEFLFRVERDPNPDGTGKVFEITEYQLASRLSYFLWSTMPDEELFKAAKAGTLRANLDSHLARMLKDPKAISLTKDFMGQWLEIRGLHEATNADPALLASMLGETERFFDDIVKNNRSIMDFLDADYTFVDERLAKLYGIPGVTGDEFQKVQVDKSRRGGIFTHASFLTLTSKPLGSTRRTSPVLRGKWILENIFNQTIPPPPPNVPSLDFDPNKELKGTVRQIFEQHRVDPTCAGCHARMDPYGFALENYDGFGAWRDQDNRVDVDASGEIDGRTFTTPVEFRAMLASRKDDFRRGFIKKMLSYALGRGMRGYDRPALDAISAAVQRDGDTLLSVVVNVAKSYPFNHARGLKSETAAPAPDVSSALYHPVFIPPPVDPNAPGRGGRGRGRGTPPPAVAPAPAAPK